MGKVQSALKRRDQLGAAAAPLAIDEGDRLGDVPGGGGQGSLGENLRASGEEGAFLGKEGKVKKRK